MSDNAMTTESVGHVAAQERLERRLLRAPAAGDETAANAGVAIRAMMIAAMVFALFGSAEMRHAARNLPGDTLSDMLVEAADGWHLMMQRLGPALAEPVVRDAFDSLRDKRWQW
jgi:hypothetical protein